MDFDEVKKNARTFQVNSRLPSQPSATKTPARPVAARLSPMSAAQEKLYGSLTADNGFSVQDARRLFITDKPAAGSKG